MIIRSDEHVLSAWTKRRTTGTWQLHAVVRDQHGGLRYLTSEIPSNDSPPDQWLHMASLLNSGAVDWAECLLHKIRSPEDRHDDPNHRVLCPECNSDRIEVLDRTPNDWPEWHIYSNRCGSCGIHFESVFKFAFMRHIYPAQTDEQQEPTS